jgi:hypothetical protein
VNVFRAGCGANGWPALASLRRPRDETVNVAIGQKSRQPAERPSGPRGRQPTQGARERGRVRLDETHHEELRQLECILTKALRAPQATANPDEDAQLGEGRAIGAQRDRDFFER